MKKIMKASSALIVMFFVVFTSCKKTENNPSTGIDPFSNGGNEKNMIVIISDMHLGADTSYAECVKNRGPLEKILKHVKSSPNVNELVIAGDLVDEWFILPQ